MLDERCDSCFAGLRALVELVKVERECTSFVLADSPSLERAAEDSIPGLGQHEDDLVAAALSSSQLSAARVRAGLARLAEASGDRRGRLAQPRLGTRQLVLGAVLP